MNQRAHIRHAVDMVASLSAEAFSGRPCRVRDFCLGGLLVLFDGETGPDHRLLHRDDPVKVTLEVEGSRGRRDIVLPARVARTLDNGVGLAFDHPDPTDLLALQNQVRSHIEDEKQRRRSTKSDVDARPLLEDMKVLLREFLLSHMEHFLPRVREALTDEAEKTSTNEQQHPWFEAIQKLNRSAEDVVRSFVQKAGEPLDKVVHGAIREDMGSVDGLFPGQGGLSLVDKELFEDWLTLKVMASKAEGEFHEELLPLQLRLDHLLGISLSTRRNPLHPAVICAAFGEALKLVPLRARTDRVVLRVFEQEVVNHLADLYRQVNRSLIEAGILPDLDVGRYLSEHYTPHNPPPPETPKKEVREPASVAPQSEQADDAVAANADRGADATGGAAAAQPQGAESGEPAAVPAGGRPKAAASESASQFALQQRIANHAYETVRSLLSARTVEAARERHRETAAAAPSQRTIVPGDQFQQILRPLQSELSRDDSVPLPERIQRAVETNVGEDHDLDADVQAAVEVIHHLFQGIGDNPALSSRVRKAIRRLEVPFLRLLLVDDSFLSEEQHPARQMLNRIAHLGVRGSANLDNYEAAIDQHVEGVVESYDNDINIFESSLQKLDELVTEQKRTYQRNLKRVTEAYEGKQKVVLARREVNEALERRIGGKTVPRAVLALIDAGWRQLLVQSLLRQGRDSRQWHEYLGVVDSMIAAGNSAPGTDQLQSVVASIKQGLAQVDPAQVRNPRLVAELRSLLSARVREEEGEPRMVDVPRGMVDVSSPASEAALSETQRRWRRRAQRHEVGDWFEAREGEELQQLRLAWTDADRQLFVFVNHQGMKIQEIGLEEFASRLEERTMEPVDNMDAPAFDRGLESMVQRVYDQMAHQATHDDLTGLLNRREFERRLRQRLQTDEARSATLVHLDIDQFKVVNNTGGPEVGDELLREMAQLLHETFPGALLGRLGGDEFALWLEGINPEAGLRAVESLRERVEKHRFRPGEIPYAVTISCGIVHRQGRGDTAGNLMQAADAAFHAAKDAGRNRVQTYDAEDKEMARRDDVMTWVTRINDALDEDRLELRCQRIEPTVPGQGRPAYEVLLSIRSEKGEIVPPSEFMQAAERYNRMHAVDRWVIANVLRWMHANPDVVKSLDHISINLSGHSLNDSSLPEFLFEHFRRYPVARERLCFEVTETTAISNLEDAADFIHALQDVGCRFSLDDFGSGLASYGYLKHLPVNYIKIDGSFIRDVASDPADLALVRSINEMGHLMGKRTIAEYVENDEIRERMREIGVDYVQGFGVEKPRPLETLTEQEAQPAGT